MRLVGTTQKEKRPPNATIYFSIIATLYWAYHHKKKDIHVSFERISIKDYQNYTPSQKKRTEIRTMRDSYPEWIQQEDIIKERVLYKTWRYNDKGQFGFERVQRLAKLSASLYHFLIVRKNSIKKSKFFKKHTLKLFNFFVTSVKNRKGYKLKEYEWVDKV